MLITLLTDFGTSDYFVGAMKGAILSVNREARIFDITHEIPAHDIQAGAFTLLAAYQTFPTHTIHVAVVDPGVGSMRRPLLIDCGGQFFVGPDNGLFSYVCERESDCRIFQLTNEKYFRRPLSPTFHGRDLFAPVAGALSNGVEPHELGVEVSDYVRLESFAPKAVGGRVEAAIIHIDRFGNCITSLTSRELTAEMIARGARLLINGREVRTFRRFFAEGASGEGELFAIWGSAGFLEVVANRASAAELLNVRRNDPVSVMIQ